MSQPVITVDSLGKQYKIGRAVKRGRSFGRAVIDTVMTPYHRLKYLRDKVYDDNSFWALKDISFEVKPGEVLGVIGRNGAGKSTLLKILSRITDPTEGQATLHGRVGSLLEVGTGFHAELSGRENVYLSGAILGMKKAEIDRKFDQIVAFSEIEKFIDTPVKRYSSGMRVRLGFAVAAHLEPDILIVDEVLAVGDASFQQRCLGRMDEVSKSGRTILFVSHNMGAIQTLCTRAILLRGGQMVVDGPVDEVVGNYLAFLSAGADHAFEDNPNRTGDGQIRLTAARGYGSHGNSVDHLVSGEPVTLEFEYSNPNAVRNARCILTIYNQFGVAVTNFDTSISNYAMDDLACRGVFRLGIPRLPLPLGRYRVAAAVHVNGRNADSVPNALMLTVSSSTFNHGGRTPPPQYCACMVAHQWGHDAGAGH